MGTSIYVINKSVNILWYNYNPSSNEGLSFFLNLITVYFLLVEKLTLQRLFFIAQIAMMRAIIIKAIAVLIVSEISPLNLKWTAGYLSPTKGNRRVVVKLTPHVWVASKRWIAPNHRLNCAYSKADMTHLHITRPLGLTRVSIALQINEIRSRVEYT